MEVNPALEEGKQDLDEDTNDDPYSDTDDSPSSNEESSGDDDFNIEDYLINEAANYKTRLPNATDDEEEYETPMVAAESIYDKLQDQLQMLDLDERQETIATHLIGSVDEDGYLRRPIPAIINDMTFRYNLRATPEEVGGPPTRYPNL